jgi:hypothetical protein
VADNRCEREDEVLAGRQSGDARLREHVASCPGCAELVALADAILDERNTIVREASVPGSGAAWWRIQMRARRDAERAAARTVTTVQAVAIAAALAIALAFLGTPSLTWVTQSVRPSWMSFAPWGLPLILGALLWLTLAPLAVWLAVTEE